MTDALSDPRQARDRVQRIRMGLETLASLQTDIADAYQAQDWHTLGYDSWSSYVESEFVGVQLRLPKDERRELVGSLREAGMSTRAIASATGVDQKTISNDLRSGEENSSPEPPPVTGLDGKTYTPREPQPVETEPTDAEPVEAELVDEEPSQEVTPQTPKTPKPRTDVVNTINRLLSRANDAADAADEITKKHLANRSDEAALWERSLARHLDSLERFRAVLQEAQT